MFSVDGKYSILPLTLTRGLEFSTLEIKVPMNFDIDP